MDRDFKRPRRPYADMVIERPKMRPQTTVQPAMVTPKKRRTIKMPRLAIILSLVTALLLGVGLVLFFVLRDGKVSFVPLPSGMTEQLQFPVYYPQLDKLPAGYKYEDGSASVQAGMIFFRLINNEGKKIFLSEQAAPGADIGIDKLADFSPFDTSIGTAYAGKQKVGTTAIISTSKTLITINGSSDVAQDIVNSAAKSLALPE